MKINKVKYCDDCHNYDRGTEAGRTYFYRSYCSLLEKDITETVGFVTGKEYETAHLHVIPGDCPLEDYSN